MAYDKTTKFNVSNGNVDGSSGDDGDVNCIGNSLNAPNGLIMIVMVIMKTNAWGTEVCCVRYNTSS